ncbi:VanZ family protein [Glutamicibacter bergerei]
MPISSSRLPLRALWVLPALYLLGLICVALWPTPVDASARGALDSVLAWLHSVGVPNFVGYDLVEFGANIALFIPLGLLLGFGLRRFWLAVGFGVLATSLIEASQWLFLPQRFASGLDILANSLGALLGALCWLFWSRSRRKVRAEGQDAAPIGS